MSYALNSVGQSWVACVISVGAIIGILAVMFAYSYGGSRILFSMSRDGLLPKTFSKLNPKTNIPVLSTWILGILGALMTGIVDLKQLADVANGTFLLVAVSLVVLRKSQPNLKSSFKVTLVPALPILASICCLFLMFNFSKATWLYFSIWLSLGVVIYFTYSRKHSLLQNQNNNESALKKVHKSQI